MSVIDFYKNRIAELEKENSQLRQRNSEVEQDIVTVASTAVGIWKVLDINMVSGQSKLMMLPKLLNAVSKKENVALIEKGWENIQPILKKYEHLKNHINE